MTPAYGGNVVEYVSGVLVRGEVHSSHRHWTEHANYSANMSDRYLSRNAVIAGGHQAERGGLPRQ